MPINATKFIEIILYAAIIKWMGLASINRKGVNDDEN